MKASAISATTILMAATPAAPILGQQFLARENAPVFCSQKVMIAATPEKVWSVLTAIDQRSNWQSEITKPKLNGPLVQGTTFHWKTGGAAIQSTLHTVVPSQDLGWTGKTIGAYAVHNWTLTAVDGQTKVTVAESMEGWLVKLLKGMFQRNLAKGMAFWLDSLKRKCEE